MLIFISGSMNSGKTTTSIALARKLGAKHINVDDLRETIPNFNLDTDLDKVIDLAIIEINKEFSQGNSVVANYVLRQIDHDRLTHEVNTDEQWFITLAPGIEIAQSQRGGRELSDWELQRIRHHYEAGVASPEFGYIVDNSHASTDEVVDEILEIIQSAKKR